MPTATVQPPKQLEFPCCQGPAALQQQRLARLAVEHAQWPTDAESRRLEVAALAAIQVPVKIATQHAALFCQQLGPPGLLLRMLFAEHVIRSRMCEREHVHHAAG